MIEGAEFFVKKTKGYLTEYKELLKKVENNNLQIVDDADGFYAIKKNMKIDDNNEVVVDDIAIEALKERYKAINTDYAEKLINEQYKVSEVLMSLSKIVNAFTINGKQSDKLTNDEKNAVDFIQSYIDDKTKIDAKVEELNYLIDQSTTEEEMKQYLLQNNQPEEEGCYYGDVFLKNSSLDQDIETIIKLKTCSDTNINDTMCFVCYTNKTTGLMNSARAWGNFTINQDLSITYKSYSEKKSYTIQSGQYQVKLDNEYLTNDFLKKMYLIDVEKKDDKIFLDFKDCELIDGAYKYTGNLEFDNWSKVFAYGE